MSPERAVQEVMARYVRAVDNRDAEALVALFSTAGHERLFHQRDGTREPIAVFSGRDEIRTALSTLLPPHPPGGWAHHTTFDHIVSVVDEKATLEAQFILYGISERVGRPEVELSGYYEWALVKEGDRWLITDNTTILTVPAPSV